jgi:sec-independent protein translocase protein TatC
VKIPFRHRIKRPKVSTPDDRMTLTDHLAELRMRIIRIVLAVGVGAVLCLTFYDHVLAFLEHPYRSYCRPLLLKDPNACDLKFFGPLEGFTTRFSISAYAGVLLAIPVILWQIWKFVVPALHENEKQYAIPFIVSAVFLFLLGALIAYISLEPAFHFLISWSGKGTQATFRVSDYISFVGLMTGAFGVGLEFPLLLVFLQLVGVVNHRTLLRGWRYAIVGCVVVAAIITPSGDPFSLFALAVPMTVLYFVAALVGRRVQLKRERKEAIGDASTA